jgi:N-methylhydantoinase A
MITFVTHSSKFDLEGTNTAIDQLLDKCQEFIAGPGRGAVSNRVELFAEARYPSEIWELDVPLRQNCFSSLAQVEALRQDFHAIHQQVFGTSDPGSPIEMLRWRARVSCQLRSGEIGRPATLSERPVKNGHRQAYFAHYGYMDAVVRYFESMLPGEKLVGPAIVESPVTTVVIDPGAEVERTLLGSLAITSCLD